MPRKPVVSRTIDVICITAMVADEGKRKIFNKEYTLYKKCKSDKLYCLACQETEDDENIRVLRVVEKHEARVACTQPIQFYLDHSEKTYLKRS